MENPWHAPVVAVEDGSVKYWESGLGGCMLYLYGRSGTTYMYIHLNNDLTARNDNKGGCVKGVTFVVPNGAKVTAGQQIAWNGDSGDANGNPHLHFEVHPTAVRTSTRTAPEAGGEAAASQPAPVHVFSLALRGKLVAAGAGAATLDVERVRQYPGGRWLDIDAREVELAVPLGTDVTGHNELAGESRRRLKTAAEVVAYTLKSNATPGAIVGAPGELLLGRLVSDP